MPRWRSEGPYSPGQRRPLPPGPGSRRRPPPAGTRAANRFRRPARPAAPVHSEAHGAVAARLDNSGCLIGGGFTLTVTGRAQCGVVVSNEVILRVLRMFLINRWPGVDGHHDVVFGLVLDHFRLGLGL